MAAAGAAVLAVAAAFSVAPSAGSTPQMPLADELRPATWAMTIPTAWLIAPVPRARHGDLLDILGVRAGERAFAVPIAYGVAVVSADDRTLVVELDEGDASAIASARGSGLLLVALLRSAR